jgi:hypothetical protein
MGSDWAADTEAELIRLVGEGLSARAISKVMGRVSRNAVISKCRRIGLTLQGNKGRPSNIADKLINKKKSLNRQAPVKTGLLKRSDVPLHTFTPSNLNPPEISRCSFHELESGMCHYMIGEPIEMKYCGDKTCNPKSMWCIRHNRMVYNPVQPKVNIGLANV